MQTKVSRGNHGYPKELEVLSGRGAVIFSGEPLLSKFYGIYDFFQNLNERSRQRTTTTTKVLLIRNGRNYISFSPQIAYELIEARRSRDILQIQGLPIDGLNNRENTTIQYITQRLSICFGKTVKTF